MSDKMQDYQLLLCKWSLSNSCDSLSNALAGVSLMYGPYGYGFILPLPCSCNVYSSYMFTVMTTAVELIENDAIVIML